MNSRLDPDIFRSYPSSGPKTLSHEVKIYAWIFRPKTLPHMHLSLPHRHRTLPHRHRYLPHRHGSLTHRLRFLPRFLRQSLGPEILGLGLYLKNRGENACLNFLAKDFTSQAQFITSQTRIFTSQAQEFTSYARIFTSHALLCSSIFEVKSRAQNFGPKALPQNSR